MNTHSNSFFRAYETLSDDNKRDIYDATGMDSNEQRQASPFESAASGFGFNPFGESFWGSFTGKGDSNQKVASEKIFKDFESFFSMGNDGTREK